VDRKGACWKCSATDHKVKNCPNAAKCIICADKGEKEDHILGSRNCPAFVEALRRARKYYD
jgi:hypothetical protein